MSATDLELSIITNFEASIENEGAITVPAKAILNFAQYNTDEEVLMETSEGTQLRCTSNSAKTLIAGEEASEYPTISSIEKETSFSLGAVPLLKALHMVTFASAKTTLRPVLSGVYLRSEKGSLILVSTDSYRLSEYQLPTGSIGRDISCIIPTKVLEELKGAISGRKERRVDALEEGAREAKGEDIEDLNVEMNLSSQQIEMRFKNTKFLSRLIDGKFPDYKQIIPNSPKTTATLPVRDLSAIIKRMHYFAKETNNNLTFTFSKKSIFITTPQTQGGKDEATLPTELTGEENRIALSSSYLLDFLSHIDGGEVELRITDSMHPAVFHIPKEPNLLHLIMPLRIAE